MEAERYGPKGDALAAAILALPKMERLVVTLAYFDELRDAEVARVLDTPLDEVIELRQRALRRLADQLPR